MRRYGETPEKGIRYTRRPGVYAILPIGQNILLTHQSLPVPEFQLPGGGIDAGEHPIPALHREVMEETGWIIGTPRRIGFHRRFTYMPEYDLEAEKICHIYIARPIRPLCPPTEDGHSAVIVPAHVALDLVENPGDRAFLARFIIW